MESRPDEQLVALRSLVSASPVICDFCEAAPAADPSPLNPTQPNLLRSNPTWEADWFSAGEVFDPPPLLLQARLHDEGSGRQQPALRSQFNLGARQRPPSATMFRVWRPHDGLDLSQPHTIEFELTFDELPESLDQVRISNLMPEFQYNWGAVIWYLNASRELSATHHMQWQVLDNPNSSRFCLPIQPKVTYHIRVEVDPRQRLWRATVSDGVNMIASRGDTGGPLPIMCNEEHTGRQGLSVKANSSGECQFAVDIQSLRVTNREVFPE